MLQCSLDCYAFSSSSSGNNLCVNRFSKHLLQFRTPLVSLSLKKLPKPLWNNILFFFCEIAYFWKKIFLRFLHKQISSLLVCNWALITLYQPVFLNFCHLIAHSLAKCFISVRQRLCTSRSIRYSYFKRNYVCLIIFIGRNNVVKKADKRSRRAKQM